MPEESNQHRIVIVGGGVAGIELAAALGRRRRCEECRQRAFASVTLVDHAAAHVWKPILHTIAAGTRDVAQQQTAYLGAAREAGFMFRAGSLRALDRTAGEIELAPLFAADGRVAVPESRIGYDTLVLAVGSRANDFGTPGVAQHCMAIDSLREARAFNRELRLRMTQCVTQGTELAIAVVGGGATGVQLSAELIELRSALAAYGGGELTTRMTITLLEAGPRLLPAFPEDISAATKARLEALGIRVMLATKVESADADAYVLEGGARLAASLKVWAAGVKAPDFLAGFGGLETGRGNRLVVAPSLGTTRDSKVFAIGDCASLTPAGATRPLPTTAQVAHQQAQHLARHLPDLALHGTPVPAFAYHDFGSLVSLADYDAYGSLGQFGLLKGVTFRGRLAQLSHALLYRSHQAKLHGFWRGGLLWLVDWLNARARPPVRLD